MLIREIFQIIISQSKIQEKIIILSHDLAGSGQRFVFLSVTFQTVSVCFLASPLLQTIYLQNLEKPNLAALTRHSPPLSASWRAGVLLINSVASHTAPGLWSFTAVAVSTSSRYDWVCRGNRIADEFRPPWGEWVIEEGWGGRLDSYWTVLGNLMLKNNFLCSKLSLSALLVEVFYAWGDISVLLYVTD